MPRAHQQPSQQRCQRSALSPGEKWEEGTSRQSSGPSGQPREEHRTLTGMAAAASIHRGWPASSAPPGTCRPIPRVALAPCSK